MPHRAQLHRNPTRGRSARRVLQRPLRAFAACLALPATGAAGGTGEPPEPPEPYRAAACHILILHAQAFDPQGSTRSRDAARRLAEEILARAREPGSDFDALCRRFSEDRLRRENGGLIGTFRRGDLTRDFAALEETLFRLEPGAVGGPVESPLGFHILRRLPLEEWCGRHVLVQYRGAEKAPPEVTRSRDEALATARRLLGEIRERGADFAALARRHSDAPDRVHGGSLGVFTRGEILQELEAALASIPPGATAGPVETRLGFHIVRREEVRRLPLSLILIAPRAPGEAAREEARALAGRVHREALAPGADFAALAGRNSSHRSHRWGGFLGSIAPEVLPRALVAPARGLAPGQVSEAIETSRGFAILKHLATPVSEEAVSPRRPGE